MDAEIRSEPQVAYAARLADRRQDVERLERQDQRLSQARGLVFLFGIVVAIGFYSDMGFPWRPVAPLIVLFAVMVWFHNRLVARLIAARRAVRYYEAGLDRLQDRWGERGSSGNRYRASEHLYADDLDLFGQRSLFQLLCRARTRLGEDRLASWLKAPADAATIRSRQAAIQSLRDDLDLRESFALLDAKVHEDLDQNQLLLWCQEIPVLMPAAWRYAAWCLCGLAVVAISGWVVGGWSYHPLLALLVVEIPFVFLFRKQIRHVAATVDKAGSGLAILSQVLELIEQQRWNEPHLSALTGRLEQEGRSPSAHIRRLHSLIQHLNNSLQNQFFAPIALVLCLPIHLVHAIELWRTHVGAHIPEWLDTVAEIEALCSLAGFTFERADFVFPDIADERLCFQAVQLGHPLIRSDDVVRNSVTLDQQHRLLLVSGSNMSGKSTLLRTVGTNAVLALAGAPVCAERLRISVMQIATAMHASDSLQAGQSLFYAVVSRLKTIVDATESRRSVLFLLDEILPGTNSHDRRIGAEGVIRRLVQAPAVGLVTTHDLALTEIVQSMGDLARNVHFEDRLVDGRMTFDYQVRPGVVQKSNALELMRMIGLDVDPRAADASSHEPPVVP